MKPIAIKKIIFFTAGIFSSVSLFAQKEYTFGVSARADLVSQYIWRGTELGQTSIQPQATVGFEWIKLTVWGSSDFNGLNREIDPSISVQLRGFSVGVTGYWASDTLASKYGKNHVFEGNIAYTFNKFPLTLEWNTAFAGEQDKSYSSYAKVAYEPEYKGWQVGLAAGLTPWKNEMLETSSFAFTELTTYIGKSVGIAGGLKLDGMMTLTYNPHLDQLFWVVSVGFSFE